MANIPFISSTASRRRLSRTRSASDLIRDKALRKQAISVQQELESPGDSSDEEDGKNNRLHISSCPSLPATTENPDRQHPQHHSKKKNKISSRHKRSAARHHNHKTRQHLFFTPEQDERTRISNATSSSNSSSITAKRNNTQASSQHRTESTTSSTATGSISGAAHSRDQETTSHDAEANPSNDRESSILPGKEEEIITGEDKREEEEENSNSDGVPRFLECEEPTDDESVISSMMDCSQTVYCYGGFGASPPHPPILLVQPVSYARPPMMMLPPQPVLLSPNQFGEPLQERCCEDTTALPFSASSVLQQRYQTIHNSSNTNDIRYHPNESHSPRQRFDGPYWQAAQLQQQQQQENPPAYLSPPFH